MTQEGFPQSEFDTRLCRNAVRHSLDEIERMKLLWDPECPENQKRMNPEVQEFIQNTGAVFVSRSHPEYLHGTDEIAIPTHKKFLSEENYYSVIFHELGHWTLHESRLDRQLLDRRPRKNDSPERFEQMEELVAEFTSRMLCAIFGLSNRTMNTEYLAKILSRGKVYQLDLDEAIELALQATEYLMELDQKARQRKSQNPRAPERIAA